MIAPTLRVEHGLIKSGHAMVAGIDGVGRGALAGPVSVGVVVVHQGIRRPLAGVRDSKDLTPNARNALVPRIQTWAVDYAVGHASPDEIDEVGIIGALRIAGHRAVLQLREPPDVVLLDGSHDWFTPPEQVSFLELAAGLLDVSPPVVTRVKADQSCASVAAASVLAKVERDAHMTRLGAQFPAYQWQDNKGYASASHIAALGEHGACTQHRRSWNLPGL